MQPQPCSASPALPFLPLHRTPLPPLTGNSLQCFPKVQPLPLPPFSACMQPLAVPAAFCLYFVSHLYQFYRCRGHQFLPFDHPSLLQEPCGWRGGARQAVGDRGWAGQGRGEGLSTNYQTRTTSTLRAARRPTRPSEHGGGGAQQQHKAAAACNLASPHLRMPPKLQRREAERMVLAFSLHSHASTPDFSQSRDN